MFFALKMNWLDIIIKRNYVINPILNGKFMFSDSNYYLHNYNFIMYFDTLILSFKTYAFINVFILKNRNAFLMPNYI